MFRPIELWSAALSVTDLPTSFGGATPPPVLNRSREPITNLQVVMARRDADHRPPDGVLAGEGGVGKINQGRAKAASAELTTGRRARRACTALNSKSSQSRCIGEGVEKVRGPR